MARLFTAGFESGITINTAQYGGERDSNGVELRQVGTTSYQTTTARNGGRALQCNASGSNYEQIVGLTHTVDVPMYVRFYLRFTATPSETLQLFAWRLNAVVVASLDLLTTGAIRYNAPASGSIGNSSVLSVDTWYMVEASITIPAAGNGSLEFKIDGVTQQGPTSANVGTTLTTTTHRIGHVTGTETATTLYIDDLAINDGSGANQASWAGPGNVSLLLPTADDTKGTGWEAPQTTGSDTTNLYDAVDNVPPAGVAHSDVDANANKYIFNAANLGAASNYRASCATPNTILPANGVIALSQAYMRASCNSTTGTNNMELQGITPADSAVTCNVEQTAAAGTEPVGWKSFRTAVTYSPSLTLSTAPVVEATKILTGSTRAHMVDQMGLMIEWYAGDWEMTLTTAAETDAAQTLDFDKPIVKALTSATESDGAQILSITHGGPTDVDLTAAAETDAAQALSFSKPIHMTLTPATTSDAAQALDVDKPIFKSITTATGTDAAQTLSVTKTIYKSLTEAASTDAAQVLAFVKPIAKSLTAAAETDAAQALSFVKPIAKSLTPASEADAGQALSFIKPIYKSLTPTVSSDAAQTLSITKTIYKAITTASETDAAQLLDFSQNSPTSYTLTPATETDVARPLVVTHIHYRAIAAAVSSDAAQTLSFIKPIVKAITAATETDAAQTLSITKTIFKSLTTAATVDATQLLSVTKVIQKSLTAALATDVATTLSIAKAKTITAATETDAAVVLIWPIQKLLTAALELAQAIGLDFEIIHPVEGYAILAVEALASSEAAVEKIAHGVADVEVAARGACTIERDNGDAAIESLNRGEMELIHV